MKFGATIERLPSSRQCRLFVLPRRRSATWPSIEGLGGPTMTTRFGPGAWYVTPSARGAESTGGVASVARLVEAARPRPWGAATYCVGTSAAWGCVDVRAGALPFVHTAACKPRAPGPGRDHDEAHRSGCRGRQGQIHGPIDELRVGDDVERKWRHAHLRSRLHLGPLRTDPDKAAAVHSEVEHLGHQRVPHRLVVVGEHPYLGHGTHHHRVATGAGLPCERGRLDDHPARIARQRSL